MSQSLQQIKQIIATHARPLQEEFGVQKLGVFGSFARNDQTERSDIDILVEFSQSPSLFKFLKLEETLSALLGRKVDLVTKKALKPAIKDDVLKGVIYV